MWSTTHAYCKALGHSTNPYGMLWAHSLAEPNFRKTITTSACYSCKVLILLNWKLILRITHSVKTQGEINYAKPNDVSICTHASSSFPKNWHRKPWNGIKVKGKTQPRDKVFYEIKYDLQKLISLYLRRFPLLKGGEWTLFRCTVQIKPTY